MKDDNNLTTKIITTRLIKNWGRLYFGSITDGVHMGGQFIKWVFLSGVVILTQY
jgi:hypothetical protein